MKSSQEARSRKTTLHQLPVSEGMKEKLGKAGLDLTTMEAVYRRGGTKALLAVRQGRKTADWLKKISLRACSSAFR